MSGRWFDSSRQIFWDNDQQDLTIPGALNAQSATFDSVSSLAGQVQALTTSSIVSNNLSSLTGQISSLIALNVSSIRGQVGALTTSSIVTNNLSSQTSQISSLMALNFSTVQGTINGLTTSSIVSNNLSSFTGQISSLITLNISSLRGQVGALSSLTIQTSSLTAVNISSFQGEIGQLTTSSIVSNNLSSLTSQVSSLTALNISSLRGQVGALTTSSIVSNNISSLTSQSGALTTSSIRTNSLFANGAVTLSNLPVNNVLMIASTQQILTSNSDTGVWGYYYSAPSGTNIANRIRVGSYSGTGQAFTINEAGGNVGIGDGMYNPVYTLDVVGTGNFRNLNASNLQVPILGTNSITANSYSWQTTTSNDNFNTELTSAFNQQGSNFTLECYLYPTFLGTFNTVLSVNNGSIATGGKEFRIYYNGSNGFGAGYPSGATTTGFTTGSAIALNTWYHLALVRNATNISLYLNGSNWASATMFNYTTSENRQLQVFAPRDGVQTGQGLINSIRFTIGQALYTGPFTPPTQQLTNTSVGTSGANVAASITGTVAFLGAVRNSFTYQDASPTILTITVAGKPIISVSTPTTFISNLIINGGVSMSNLPANNVLMIASTQQILLSNSANGVYSYYQSAESNVLLSAAPRIRIGSYFSNAGQALTFNESGGNVGIGQGMFNPLFTLDVNGTARIQNSNFSNLVLQTAQDSNSSYILFQKSTLAGRVGWFGQNSLGPSFSSIFGLFSPATTNIGLYAAGNTSIFCSSNGNVGVGTSNPAYRLDVNGTGQISTFIVGASNLPPVFSTNDHLFVNGFLDVYNTAQASTLIRMAGAFGTNYIQSGRASTASAFAPADIVFGSPGATSEYVRFTSNGRVGIGTATPAYTLDITGSSRILKDSEGLLLQGSVNSNPLYITFQKPLGPGYVGWFGFGLQGSNLSSIFGMQTSAGASIGFYAGGAGEASPSLFLGSNSRVGILTNTPAYTLDVNGDIRLSGQLWTNAGVIPVSMTTLRSLTTNIVFWSNAYIQALGYANYSDQRVKENIVNADTSICYSTMQGIDLKYFKWNSNFQSTTTIQDRHQLGFIAQEIQKVFPKSVVQQSSYGYDDFCSIESGQLNAMHFGATKKLMELVEQQGSTIQGIQQQLSTLQRI